MTDQVKYRNPVKAVGFAQALHVMTQDLRISHGAFRLYAHYLSFAQQTGRCWPGRDKIADLFLVNSATISRWNTELEKSGYITRQRRTGMTSITWIEDAEQIPELKEMAESILAERCKNVTTDVATMQRLSLQECNHEEEPRKEPKKKNQSSANTGLNFSLEKQEQVDLSSKDPPQQKITRPGLIAILQNPYAPAGYADILVTPDADDIRCSVCGKTNKWVKTKKARRKPQYLTCTGKKSCGALFRVTVEGDPEIYALKLPPKAWIVDIESAPEQLYHLETTQDHLEDLLVNWDEDPSLYVELLQWYAMHVHNGRKVKTGVIQRCNTGYSKRKATQQAEEQQRQVYKQVVITND